MLGVQQPAPQHDVHRSYGDMLGKTRWANRLYKELSQVSDDNDEGYCWDRRTLNDDRACLSYANEILECNTLRRHCKFQRFTELPIELQTQIIEWLDYDDLKSFEQAGLKAKYLTRQHTKQLDAALFRSKFSGDAPTAAPVAAESSTPKDAAATQVATSYQLHPLLNWTALKLELASRWPRLSYTMPSINPRKPQTGLFRNIQEITENVSEPALSVVRFTVWGAGWSEYVHNSLGKAIRPYQFTVKATAPRETVTLEEFMKALLDAFQKVHSDFQVRFNDGYHEPSAFNQVFQGFSKQHLDENGNLHLSGCRWKSCYDYDEDYYYDPYDNWEPANEDDVQDDGYSEFGGDW